MVEVVVEIHLFSKVKILTNVSNTIAETLKVLTKKGKPEIVILKSRCFGI